MFLHAGKNKNIRKKEIIGIFDMDSATVSPVTRKFLTRMEKKGNTQNVSWELPKSFILCGTGDHAKVYISPIAPQTLVPRAEEKR